MDATGSRDAWNAKSHVSRSPRIWAVAAFVFVLALCIFPKGAHAQLTVPSFEGNISLPVVQLLYDGHWLPYDSYNGSIVRYGEASVLGKIAVFVNHIAPHEPVIRKAQAAGAIAVLICRVSRGEQYPGSSMYTIDGSNRKELTIPVFETMVRRSTNPFTTLPPDTEIVMFIQPNHYISRNKEKFQLFMNIFQTLLQFAIVVIGLYRLRQFFYFSYGQFQFLSIGPVCIVLEIIGALLRVACTAVDPFYTYRLMPDQASMILVTISFPFTLSAGILLTFFWAETLTTSSVETSAFITKYRIPALVCVVGLFIIEIICSALRSTVQGKLPISPNYISLIFYEIVAIALIIFYITTAIAVMRRLQKMKNDRAREAVQVMSLRVAASSVGYILFAVVWILYVIYAGMPWGVNLTLNGAFLGDNISGLLQVAAIRPIHPNRKVKKRSSATASSSEGAKIDSAGPLRTVDNQRSATARGDTHAATASPSSSSSDDSDSMYQTDAEMLKNDLVPHPPGAADYDDDEEEEEPAGSLSSSGSDV